MAEKGNTEVLERIVHQIGQLWVKVKPQLQLLILKLVQSLIPVLQKLQSKLTVPEVVPASVVKEPAVPETQEVDMGADSPDLAIDADAEVAQVPPVKTFPAATASEPKNKAMDLAMGFSAQAIAGLVRLLTKWQYALEGKDAQEVPMLEAAPPESAMVAQVKREFGIAWQFTQEQVTPRVLTFLQKVVDKLDPIATNIWQKASAKAADTPSVVNAWEKVQTNEVWQKTSTAIAPLGRLVVDLAKKIPLSDAVKGILNKRAGTIALVTIFAVLLLLKPSHAHSRNAKTVAVAPAVKVSQPKTVAPTTKTTGKTIDDMAKPEKNDVALSPEQIAIAKIQTQVSEVANQYGENILGSVETSFQRGRLIVALSNDWYQMSPSDQEKLINDLDARSRSLNFKKLFVADADNNVIARTPVTGEGIVILRK